MSDQCSGFHVVSPIEPYADVSTFHTFRMLCCALYACLHHPSTETDSEKEPDREIPTHGDAGKGDTWSRERKRHRWTERCRESDLDTDS